MSCFTSQVLVNEWKCTRSDVLRRSRLTNTTDAFDYSAPTELSQKQLICNIAARPCIISKLSYDYVLFFQLRHFLLIFLTNMLIFVHLRKFYFKTCFSFWDISFFFDNIVSFIILFFVFFTVNKIWNLNLNKYVWKMVLMKWNLTANTIEKMERKQWFKACQYFCYWKYIYLLFSLHVFVSKLIWSLP